MRHFKSSQRLPRSAAPRRLWPLRRHLGRFSAPLCRWTPIAPAAVRAARWSSKASSTRPTCRANINPGQNEDMLRQLAEKTRQLIGGFTHPPSTAFTSRYPALCSASAASSASLPPLALITSTPRVSGRPSRDAASAPHAPSSPSAAGHGALNVRLGGFTMRCESEKYEFYKKMRAESCAPRHRTRAQLECRGRHAFHPAAWAF